VLAHQGQPKERNFISLEQHSRILNKYVKIKFVDDVIGKKASNAVKKLKNKEVLLLENVRFLKEEFNLSEKNRFVKTFLDLGFDYYINDAFSVSHRNQTSIVSFPKVLRFGIGRVMEEELKNIKKLKSKIKNSLFILGGKKTKDLIPLLKNKKILTGGHLSLLSLISKGYNLGEQNKILRNQFGILPEIKKYSKNITDPIDLAISVKGKRKIMDLDDFPQKYPVWGIGDRTIKLYKKEIQNLKQGEAIFFKGSMGRFQHKGFEIGTREILKAISKSKAFSVIAGGQSLDALKKFKINKNKFNYVSLSGGALVCYISGKKLPGLSALGLK